MAESFRGEPQRPGRIPIYKIGLDLQREYKRAWRRIGRLERLLECRGPDVRGQLSSVKRLRTSRRFWQDENHWRCKRAADLAATGHRAIADSGFSVVLALHRRFFRHGFVRRGVPHLRMHHTHWADASFAAVHHFRSPRRRPRRGQHRRPEHHGANQTHPRSENSSPRLRQMKRFPHASHVSLPQVARLFQPFSR